MDSRLVGRLLATLVTLGVGVVVQGQAIAETLFPVLQQWTFQPQSQTLQFQTKTAVQPSYFVLREPSRIVVDIQGTSWEAGSITQVYNGNIRQIRVAEFTEGVTRFVLETAEPTAMLNADVLNLRSFPTEDGNTVWQLSLGNSVATVSTVNPSTNTTGSNAQGFPPALLPPIIRDSVIISPPPLPDNLRK